MESPHIMSRSWNILRKGTPLKGIWTPAWLIIMALAISMIAMISESPAQDITILNTDLKGGVTKTNPAIPATG